ncbi:MULTISPECIES: DUF4279 domain-containing protein [unclassified Streptomyces]|uniref:DUF4279 domain-containing protein n=1 Tax=unclassified Streptomyces TaxID=2593676 RepID=UPI00382EEEC1
MSDIRQPGDSWILTAVTLVVKKDDLDPDSVTERLGLIPSDVRLPGVDRWNPAGDTDGQWRLQCDERTSRILSEQLDVILRAAEGCTRVLEMLRAEGCETTIVISGFAGNGSQIIFSGDEMARIYRLQTPVKIIPNINER